MTEKEHDIKSQEDQKHAQISEGYRTNILTLLTLVYAFNFIDR